MTTRAREITRRFRRGRALADRALAYSMIWGYRSRIAITSLDARFRCSRCKSSILADLRHFCERTVTLESPSLLTEQQFCPTMIGITQSLFTGDNYVRSAARWRKPGSAQHFDGGRDSVFDRHNGLHGHGAGPHE